MSTAPRSTAGLRSLPPPPVAPLLSLSPPLPLPALPVLPSTALALEFALGAPSLDLSALTAIYLRDPLATLDLFLRAGEEAGEPLRRVEDCLGCLSIEAWPGLGGARPPVPGCHFPPSPAAWSSQVAAFAGHGRQVALRARELAASPMPERAGLGSLDPAEAYLLGLLHEWRRVPRLLGWSASPLLLSAWQAGLPPWLAQMETPPWSALLLAAHTQRTGLG
jgi:hypothetical protein